MNSPQLPRSPIARYGLAVAIVAAGWGLRSALTAWEGPGLPTYITFYPAVMVAALLGGLGPGLLATALTMLLVVFWILPPLGQFGIASPVDRLGVALFTCMGLFMSTVAELYRRNREKAAAYDREAALRETRREKEFLATLLEKAEQPFAVGYPDGRLSRLNRAYEQLTGYTAAELRAPDWSTVLTPPEWRELEKQKLDQLIRTGQPVRYEKEYVRKDGTRVPIELLVHLARDAEGQPEYYYSFLTDITKRKRAEEALKLTQASVDGAAEMVAWFTSDGKVYYVNDATCRTLGYTREELMNMTALDFSPGFTQEQYEEHWREVRKRKSFTLQPLHRRKDGSTYTAEVLVNHVVYGGQEFLFAYGRDITERKKAEEALRQSELFYRQTLESIPGMVFTTRPDGYCDYQSQQWVDYTGIPLAEHLGDGWNQLLHPEDRPRAFAAWRGAVEGRAPYDLEYRVRRYDGAYEWFKVIGRPILDGASQIVRWFGVALKIEEFKQAEEALRRGEEQFRTLADSIPNLAWWANGDGYITWYNRRWYEYTGTTPEQMEGWGWQSVHDPEMLPQVLERWKASIATGEPFEMEFPLRGADGRFRRFLTRGYPLKDAQGRVLRWFGTNTDVDELKRTADALQQSQEHLKLSLREKEVMLKEIHHRVKNNLQVIASLVDLQTNTLADPALQGIFQDVRDRVRSMALVHEKLYQSESLAQVDFADYARSLLNYIARSHGSSENAIALKLDLQPVLLSIDTAVPCGLILNELVSNAFKHAFRGRANGEITAALGTSPDAQVFLRVSDNGVGLPAGMDWQQSRSLGLRLIRLLAGQLGASVSVHGNGGTKFEITFQSKLEEGK